MILKKKNIFFTTLILFILCVFWIKEAILLDPDFGHHLRTGQIILEKGFPQSDPYSYTMPSYSFANYEWLGDVLITLLYYRIGYFGLALIFSIFTILVILIQIKQFKTKWMLLPTMFCLAIIFPFASVRPQIIGWLFFSVLIKMILNKKIWDKWLFYLPILFLLWAQLFGGFVLGIAVLVFYMFAKFIEEKKIVKREIILIILCAFVTLINPYGFRLWQEILNAIFDAPLRWNISEWMPAILNLHLSLWFYFVFSIILTFRFRKKFSILELILYSIFLISALSSMRNIPYWLIISLPMLFKSLNWFSLEVKKYKYGNVRLDKAYKIFFIMSLIIILYQGIIDFSVAKSLSEDAFYPKQAITYLRKNIPKGEVFSIYDWGGYLVWKFPEKKVFIQGQMPSWRLSKVKKNESKYALGEYLAYMDGEIALKELVDKYNIKILLLSNQKAEGYNKVLQNIENWLESFVFRKKNRKFPRLSVQVQNGGWQEVYKDDVAAIYERKKL